MGHGSVETEHELIALLAEEDSVTSEVFSELGITRAMVREQVAARLDAGSGELTQGQIPFTPQAKKVFELSLRESSTLGHHHIGSEHLLLALTSMTEGGARQVLAALGADAERIRSEVHKRLPPPARREPTYESGVGCAAGGAIARRPRIPASGSFTVVSDQTLGRVLMVSAGIALSDERTIFGLEDLLTACLRDEEVSRLLASLGVELDLLNARLKGEPPASGRDNEPA